MLIATFFSDTNVIIKDNQVIPAHKFILHARGSQWTWTPQGDLDWAHLNEEVSLALLEWIYTDQVVLINKEDAFKLDLMKAAKEFSLPHLLVMCERALIASVQLRNCIKLYTTAEEIGANELKEHCSRLISTHWVIISLIIKLYFSRYQADNPRRQLFLLGLKLYSNIFPSQFRLY